MFHDQIASLDGTDDPSIVNVRSRGDSISCNLTAPPLKSLSPFSATADPGTEKAPAAASSGVDCPYASSVSGDGIQTIHAVDAPRSAPSKYPTKTEVNSGRDVLLDTTTTDQPVTITELTLTSTSPMENQSTGPVSLGNTLDRQISRQSISDDSDSSDDPENDVSLPFPISFVRVTQSSGIKASASTSTDDGHQFSPSPTAVSHGMESEALSTGYNTQCPTPEPLEGENLDENVVVARSVTRPNSPPSLAVLEVPPLIPIHKCSRIASQKSLSFASVSVPSKKDGGTAVLVNGQWILQSSANAPVARCNDIEVQATGIPTSVLRTVDDMDELHHDTEDHSIGHIPGETLLDQIHASLGGTGL